MVKSGCIPVLFPYQLRFTSGLSPVFIWLGLVEEGGCLGGETEVFPEQVGCICAMQCELVGWCFK